MMEFYGDFSNFIKDVVYHTKNFLINCRFFSVLDYVIDQVWLGYCDFCIIQRILIALAVRLIFGIWLKEFKVVPFEVLEKKDYYEDPGVLEMQALLRGEDCYDTNLDQKQQLPFPPEEDDPYDKIYLAVLFYRLQRKFRNLEASCTQHNVVFQILYQSSLFQYLSRYLSSHVAVNIHQ